MISMMDEVLGQYLRERGGGQEGGREGGRERYPASNMSYDKCGVCLIHLTMEKVS
jgi:hypothetical protein